MRRKLERLALLSVLDESPWRVALVLVVAEFRGLGGRWVCRVFSVAATTRPRSEPATLRGARGCCMARINSENPLCEALCEFSNTRLLPMDIHPRVVSFRPLREVTDGGGCNLVIATRMIKLHAAVGAFAMHAAKWWHTHSHVVPYKVRHSE